MDFRQPEGANAQASAGGLAEIACAKYTLRMSGSSYQVNPDLAWRTIDGEVVILKIKTTTYYSLDPVGSFLWTAMDGTPRTQEELVARVVTEYDVDPATAARDILELLADLEREELVKIAA